ncbi:MAG: hypothetical protein NT082_02020 [Chloroflexi bacterium]|nr:hypothetical protein [Chloroflexota bacterium]
MASELPLFVQSLLMPDAHPEHPRKIELLQTQMPFIFLTWYSCLDMCSVDHD